MMAYSGGDEFPCVVGEVGSYCTKMGFAGESYPRSYFRSTTAILRDTKQRNKITKRSHDFFTRPLGGVGGGGGGDLNDDNTHTSDSNVSGDADKGWEVCNPFESSTGLIYEGLSSSSSRSTNLSSSSSPSPTTAQPSSPSPASMNANDDDDMNMSIDSPQQQSKSNTYEPLSGECYTHFLNHLSHGYETALSTDPSTTPLLLVERSYNPPPIRQKMVEQIFEEFNTPATFLARDAVCACYAVGRTTGTVIDVGYNGTVVTPVYDGYVETKGILRSPIGSRVMDEHIMYYLDALYKTKKARMKLKNTNYDYYMPLYQIRSKNHLPRREPFHTLARLDVARLCKEDGSGAGVASTGYVSLHDLVSGDGDEKTEPNDMYQQYAISPKTPYKLPDGTQVAIPQTKRFDVTELLFGKDGGCSAQIREEAVQKARDTLSSITPSDCESGSGGGDDDLNALAHLEEMRKRRRGIGGNSSGGKSSGSGSGPGSNNNKQQSAYFSHEKLVKACAPYFQSSIGELTSASIPAMFCNSVYKCDRDQQAQLLGNAILCGGGSCLSTSASSASSVDYKDGNAMPERIREEVESIIHMHTPQWRVKVSSPGLAERAVCSWLGASILGSLGSFHDMWITKAEYEEYGPSIVSRKCP